MLYRIYQFQVVYNTGNGASVEQLTLNPVNNPQLQQHQNFTLQQNPQRQYCVTSGPSLQNHLHQLGSSGASFSITPVSSSGPRQERPNLVQVHVSQAQAPPVLHQQQTMNQVIGGRSDGVPQQNGVWNTFTPGGGTSNPQHLLNLNLNGSPGTARIIRCGKDRSVCMFSFIFF